MAELAAYDRMRVALTVKYTDEWTVAHGDELVGRYANFHDAARDAGKRFGYGSYLIRQAAPIDWLGYAKELWLERYANCLLRIF